MDFDELLAVYKTAPKRENNLLLLYDAELLQYMVIFRQCGPERKQVDGLPMEPLEHTWAALWDCVTLDYEGIALMANDELVKTKMMLKRMIGMRLVFPDGTIQEAATIIIMKRIKDAMI